MDTFKPPLEAVFADAGFVAKLTDAVAVQCRTRRHIPEPEGVGRCASNEFVRLAYFLRLAGCSCLVDERADTIRQHSVYRQTALLLDVRVDAAVECSAATASLPRPVNKMNGIEASTDWTRSTSSNPSISGIS